MNFEDLPVASLRFGFQQIPEEGLEFRFDEDFTSLWKTVILDPKLREELKFAFESPIVGRMLVRKVGSKADCRGSFSTLVTGECDRCLEKVQVPLEGDLSHFLMPKEQFSKHDKPGGKVVHRPRRDREGSRHRSRSKDEYDLTDTEMDHEDLQFGAFDGITVDLETYLREALVLGMPLKWICDPQCLGLCLECGGNLNKKACRENCKSLAVEWGEA
jgi:uncharacterized metal-binding protein YceD (DUF177 family)